jgi:hypothetical protein
MIRFSLVVLLSISPAIAADLRIPRQQPMRLEQIETQKLKMAEKKLKKPLLERMPMHALGL